MPADDTRGQRSGAEPPGAEPPRLPPVNRISPAAPTVRLSPGTPAAGAGPSGPHAPVVPFTPPVPATFVVSAGRTRTIKTRLAETAATARSYQPPAPLTSPLRHPLRWIAITVVSLAGAIVFAHLAALFITGLYYLLFQVSPSAAAWWHSVIPDAALRHTVRDAAEGFYGGAAAQLLVWNPFRDRRTRYLAKPMNRLDRLEDRLRIPNLRSRRDLSFWQIPYALAIWAPVYGSVGFTVTYLLDSVIRHDIALAQHAVLALTPHASMWQRTASMDTADWDMKIVGLAASFFFGRRPLRKVFDGIQLRLAQRHATRHQPERWYYPPTFRARCAQVSAQLSAGKVISPQRPGHPHTALTVTVLALAVALAAFGYYALTFTSA